MTKISNQLSVEEIKGLIESRYKPFEVPNKFKGAEERSYPKDFTLENGNYLNTCFKCKNVFFGYKRRVICKVCLEKEPPKPINEKAEFAVQVLRKYAHQTGNMLRGTSDLSPLEEWLIIQLMLAQKEDNKACAHIGKNIISPIDKI